MSIIQDYSKLISGFLNLETLNLNYVKQLIEYRNKCLEFNYNCKNEKEKLQIFETICYINHQIAEILILPNVKNLDDVKKQVFEVELHQINQDFLQNYRIDAINYSLNLIST